ncbi:MAG: autotransporter-associated beta strand repeat-containing protein [Verrucomicrobiales bacterium]|nr:autotransporter-associated beta strand repeat-containing protein [Verrucomicrobiales bacterium]
MRKPCRLNLRSAILALAATGFPSMAKDITWDANTGTTGSQDGAGTWNTINTNWWNGANVSFAGGDNVTFGSGAGAGSAGAIAVDAAGVTAGSLTFNQTGSGSYTFNGGSITGGALVKNGTMGLRFDNANTFTSITVNNGPNSASDAALRLGNANALGTAPISLANTGTMTALYFLTGAGTAPTLTNDIQFATGAVTTNLLATGNLNLPTGQIVTLGGVLSGGNSGATLFLNNTVGAGVARFKVTNASNTVQGKWNLNRGGLEFTSDAALGNADNDIVLDIWTDKAGTGLIFGANNLTLNPNRSVTITTGGGSVIDSGSFAGSKIDGLVTFTAGGTMIKRGTGTLTLAGANTGTGGIDIREGTLAMGNTAALGTSGSITMAGGTSLSTAPLSGITPVNRNIALTGTGDTNLVVKAGAGNGAQYDGVISGTTARLFLNTDTSGDALGMQILAGNNSFTTTTSIYVNRGSLTVAHPNALGAATNHIHFDSNGGATLAFNGSYTIGNSIEFTWDTKNIDTGSNNVTLTGVLSGDQNVTKLGSGSLILNGTSTTYAGDLTVSTGSLLINGSLGTSTADVSVSAAATIGGTGSIGGNLTLADGAWLDIAGLSLNDPLLTVNGTSTLTNLSIDNLLFNGAAVDWASIGNGTYKLIDGGAVSGFDLSVVDIGGGRTAQFQQGSLDLTVVPEPSTAVFSGAGALALALLRRRRKAA